MTASNSITTASPAQVALRSPDKVMRLARIGSFHPTRISFTRSLVRRMGREAWRFTRSVFDLNAEGIGTAIYQVDTTIAPVWFIVFADNLAPEDRTDRVIAEKWDATFALTTRTPDDADVARLRTNVPLQEGGRCSAGELILSRANKSVRLFEHVVDALSQGQNPDRTKLLEVGYLIRTTAVYGNGKFGLADFDQVKADGIFDMPFQAEMLCVYMARLFSIDWVEHIARWRNPSFFKPLDLGLARGLGVGNATGLGMAPFLIKHPILIDRWITAREVALARVRAVDPVGRMTRSRFIALLDRATAHLNEWPTTDLEQLQRNAALINQIPSIVGNTRTLSGPRIWDQLVRWAEDTLALDGQELINSLLIELHPDLVDELESETGSDERMVLDPKMTLGELKLAIEDGYDWSLAIDFAKDSARTKFWYRSAEKEEPRLGYRFKEPGEELEMRIGIAHDVTSLYRFLGEQGPDMFEATIAGFLLSFPQWRETTRRIQNLAKFPYGEIRDNLLDANCRPIDLLRCKLAIFGATKFDPKSNLWTRIALFQGAPLADELNRKDADDWAFPTLTEGLAL